MNASLLHHSRMAEEALAKSAGVNRLCRLANRGCEGYDLDVARQRLLQFSQQEVDIDRHSTHDNEGFAFN